MKLRFPPKFDFSTILNCLKNLLNRCISLAPFLWDTHRPCRPRSDTMQCLIRIYTVSLQNVIFKFWEKIPSNTPKIGNGLVLPIREGKSILLTEINVLIFYSLQFWQPR